MRIDPRAWLHLPGPTLLLAGVTLAVGALIVSVALDGTRTDELLATGAKPPAPLALDVAAAARAADLAPIKTQPLWHASRAFYTAPLRDALPAAPPRPDYRLAGTIIVPRKPAVALLTSRAGGATKRVKPGDDLDGWTVQAVERRQVTLTWRNERVEISTTQALASAGLKRVPFARQRLVSSGGVQSLGATGSAPAAMGGPITDQPRLYRPPPQP